MTKKETRTRRTPEEWRAIVLEYEQSTDATDAFCEARGIHRSMLDRARRNAKLKHDRGDKRNLAKLQGAKPGTELVVAGERKLSARNHPPELREKAIELYTSGVTSPVEIADRIGIPGKAPAVSYWIVAHRKKHGGPRSKMGRPPKQELLPAIDTPSPSPAKQAIGEGVKAAITLLRAMDREIMRMLRANKMQTPDTAHLYGQLALRALTGDQ